MKAYAGPTLSWSTVDGVLEVHLHRAPCNEIGLETLVDLEALAEYVSAGADGARAMLMVSDEPKGFCAGADLKALQAGLAEARAGRPGGRRARLAAVLPAPVRAVGARAVAAAREPLLALEVRDFIVRIHAAFDKIDLAPLVTVGALHGPVFGGGFELALLLDIRVADRSTRFAFPELRLGLVPGFGGIPRLEREVGQGLVRDLLFTGRTLGAQRALELGLVSQVVPRGEALAAARGVALQAARFDGAATAKAKRFVKKLPAARLAEERRTFMSMALGAVTQRALDAFVTRTDARPYLP